MNFHTKKVYFLVRTLAHITLHYIYKYITHYTFIHNTNTHTHIYTQPQPHLYSNHTRKKPILLNFYTNTILKLQFNSKLNLPSKFMLEHTKRNKFHSTHTHANRKEKKRKENCDMILYVELQYRI